MYSPLLLVARLGLHTYQLKTQPRSIEVRNVRLYINPLVATKIHSYSYQIRLVLPEFAVASTKFT